MTVRQLSMILEDVPIRRVNGGDEWIAKMNVTVGQNLFDRDMSGSDLIPVWLSLKPEMRTKLDEMITLTPDQLNGLLEEVYRIREDKTPSATSAKDAILNTLSITLTLILIGTAVAVACLYGVYLKTNEEVPSDFVMNSIIGLVKFILDVTPD